MAEEEAEKPKEMIKLVSKEGHEFSVEKQAAMVSNTIKSMLTGPGAPLRLFDVGGGEKIRGIWKCYYMEAHAAVFVVDASDPARFDEARTLLHEAYATETLNGKPLLVANPNPNPHPHPHPHPHAHPNQASLCW